MKIRFKFNYSFEDDILTIYRDEAPEETVEFTEFLNLDVSKDKGIVGIEIFYASEFFGKQNKEITKQFLNTLKEINISYDEWRNTWFINLELIDKNNHIITQTLPPLKKSEYVSPLIAGAS